ncbi:hypothetical protein DS901_15145 [Loktanella sp. D2R18]|uniref:sulfotransferase n=1 Tax=Rhodobacterales TaxID=204455 RepID=UPI000DE8F690|nr:MULTISPECIES: sulfotransferase [Rhodobacterales]MDO6588693.1 sulfotransferase [Yoonia sp. 1_MG-2023]RBW42063.1 hypothetical protein DS901_15145 [Loktanella sp. D2R18]
MQRPKVFIIGFNKTATTTLHSFFLKNGYHSVHWSLPDGRFLAPVITTNVLNGRPALASIDAFDVYSDLSFTDGTMHLEANYFYRELYRDYPDAYFLLNWRNAESWLLSRKNHIGRQYADSFLKRAAASYGANDTETETIWRHRHETFHDDVRTFFSNRPDAKFLDFDIQTDEPERLATWLTPDFDCDLAFWGKQNATKNKKKVSTSKRLRLRLRMR